MMDAWDEENYGLVKSLYPTALETCTKTQNEIAAMDAYNGDSSLKDAFSAEMQLEVLYLQKLGEAFTYRDYDEPTDEQQAAEDAIWAEIDTIEEQLDTAYKASVTAQETFATKHGYELEE
jgi:hypothetical protein